MKNPLSPPPGSGGEKGGSPTSKCRMSARGSAALFVEVVTDLAVIGLVETRLFGVLVGPQTDHRLDDVRDHDGRAHRPDQGQADRLDLLEPQAAADVGL